MPIDLKDPSTWIAGHEMDLLLGQIFGWDYQPLETFDDGSLPIEEAWFSEGYRVRIRPGYLSTTYEGAGLMLEWTHSENLSVQIFCSVDGTKTVELFGSGVGSDERYESDKLPEAIGRAILSYAKKHSRKSMRTK